MAAEVMPALLTRIEAGSSRLYDREFLRLVWLADYAADVDTVCMAYQDQQPVVAAARAFVEWDLKGTPGMPAFTCAQVDAWHAEWDKRLAVLREAVRGMETDSREPH